MTIKVSRRGLLQATAAMAAGFGIPRPGFAQGCAPREGTVRDRLWLFAIPTNIGYPYSRRRSVMTPAEGTYYLEIPNIIMVQANMNNAEGRYGSFESPLDQYAIGLRPLKRVLWSITGSGGYTSPPYRKEVLELAKKTPNFVGLYLDDFFTARKEGKLAVLTLDELKEIREQANGPGKKLDIWVTYYTGLLDLPLDDYLKLIDVVTLWTSKPADLADLESNFGKLEKVAPGLRKTLGCYFFNFVTMEPVPVAWMQLQCETGLRWLRQGRIEAMVFLGNNMMDVGFECVDWTREWIRKVGDEKL